MYEPGENENIQENSTAYPEGTAETPGTDRDSGEYHYRNGYTQKIYSDAHYVPEGENTVPPRYYTPPERPARETPAPKPKKKSGFVRALCLCLVCALLGGLCGAGLMRLGMSARIDTLEQRIEEQKTASPVIGGIAAPVSTVAPVSSGSALSANQIYELACRQVVGITTDITYTNFFGMTSSSAVSGSGFVLSEDGYILTNYHVIEYAYQSGYPVTVMQHDGSRHEAIIVGVEKANDVAVLKIDAAGLTPVSFGNSDSLSVGEKIYAVGNPLGELEFSMSQGWVSALGRVISTEESVAINMFQIDAAVNPGNSGGPVYNERGEVVGIVTAKYSSSGVEGLGFAIPINDAVKIADDLITKGYVTGKAYMGVTIDQQYNAMYARYFGAPQGAFVRNVEPGSAAETAGLLAGDIITAVGGDPIESYSDLSQALKQYSAGDSAELEVYRDGETLTLSISFDEYRPTNT